ncbi:g4086 [Coccomyxa elongata]
MERILVSQKFVKEEVQHGEELINLLKGLTEQLAAAKEVQDKQKHLFADHLRQQEQFLLEIRKFLTGIPDCQDHDMHESICNV